MKRAHASGPLSFEENYVIDFIIIPLYSTYLHKQKDKELIVLYFWHPLHKLWMTTLFYHLLLALIIIIIIFNDINYGHVEIHTLKNI